MLFIDLQVALGISLINLMITDLMLLTLGVGLLSLGTLISLVIIKAWCLSEKSASVRSGGTGV